MTYLMEKRSVSRGSDGPYIEFVTVAMAVVLGLPTAFVVFHTLDPVLVPLDGPAALLAPFNALLSFWAFHLIHWGIPALLMVAFDYRLRRSQGSLCKHRAVAVLAGWSLTWILWSSLSETLIEASEIEYVMVMFVLIGGILVWLAILGTNKLEKPEPGRPWLRD